MSRTAAASTHNQHPIGLLVIIFGVNLLLSAVAHKLLHIQYYRLTSICTTTICEQYLFWIYDQLRFYATCYFAASTDRLQVDIIFLCCILYSALAHVHCILVVFNHHYIYASSVMIKQTIYHNNSTKLFGANTGGGKNKALSADAIGVLHSAFIIPYITDKSLLDTINSHKAWRFVHFQSSSNSPSGADHLLVHLPLSIVAPKLLGVPLRNACREHQITVGRNLHTNIFDLMQIALHHKCDEKCQNLLACLEPVTEDIKNIVLPFSSRYILDYTIEDGNSVPDAIDPNIQFSFVSHIMWNKETPWNINNENFIACQIPLSSFIHHLSVRSRKEIAFIHGTTGKNDSEVTMLLSDHVCTQNCPFTLTILETNKPFNNTISTFPPELSMENEHSIINEFCEKLKPRHFEESGCMVCGALTLSHELTPKDEMPLYMDELLTRTDITLLERKTDDQQIKCIDGPIYAVGCHGVCNECKSAIVKYTVPKLALANGIWLGEVPKVLSRLNFAEKLLVARCRHNKCITYISSSGMSYLSANMISYPNPYPILYNVLPPHRDDMDELLAIVFTGVARPTDDDLKRIPLVVRRNYVRAALNWLRINNILYKDIVISEKNISSYVDGAIPSIINWSARSEGDNNIDHTRAVNDNSSGLETDNGPCTFAVSGVAFDSAVLEDINAVKAIAANHMLKGKGLAIPHESTPDTLWRNPNLFPNMFPWLFPYGLGGICNSAINGSISEHAHKKHLLNYYDKRFQQDEAFALMAFNQEQIVKGSNAGVFLSTKSKFNILSEKLLSLDRHILGQLVDKIEHNPNFRTTDENELKCFEILKDLDMVNGHVPGSVATKRYERNELWSLLSYMGAPTWFITFAPSDVNHPLCLYYAGQNTEYDERKIDLLSDRDRWRSIAHNPVASARFFHFVVNLFLTVVLKWNHTEAGLFGPTNGYYGTVEQQGRLTLHLHILIWIRFAISPERVRQRLLDPNSEFQTKMIQYLEKCHRGELVDVTVRNQKLISSAIERSDTEYKNPILQLPKAVYEVPEWKDYFKSVANDLLCRTNVHSHHPGCRSHLRQCKGRFPRKLINQTHVDDTGYIHVRHHEPFFNTVNLTLSYLLRCNTDVTCLMSGTAIKAVIAYATDYITKIGLKTPTMLKLIQNQVDRNAALVEGPGGRADKGRRLITGIINSFTSKSQIGAPMAASYLLDLPDHYKSHVFKVFYWRSFVHEVLAVFESVDQIENHPDYNVVVSSKTTSDGNIDIIAVSPIHDYIYRPKEHEQYCLYDWIRMYNKSKRAPSKNVGNISTQPPLSVTGLGLGERVIDTNKYKFLSEHAEFDTCSVYMDNTRADVVPNFVGGALPRRDAGDREFYCCTMLTLFKPWRKGLDLKQHNEMWDMVFENHPFSPRQVMIMDNLNLRYECLDARDDYSSENYEQISETVQNISEPEQQGTNDEDLFHTGIEDPTYEADSARLGRKYISRVLMSEEIRRVLNMRGWLYNTRSNLNNHVQNISLAFTEFSRNVWARRLEAARILYTLPNNIDSNMSTLDKVYNDIQYTGGPLRIVDKAYIDAINESHRNKQLSDQANQIVEDISTEFNLNEEQRRAFHIIIKHYLSGTLIQLRMHLGGIAGTGKSRVINAISVFFQRAGRSNHLLLLAPTGSAAYNIGGFTYHSALGLYFRKSTDRTLSTRVRNLLQPVKYIIIDEVSMLSCAEMYDIDTILSLARNQSSLPFGGFNIIFAGDFGQLAPPLGHSLYNTSILRKLSESTEKPKKDTKRRKVSANIAERNLTGRALWLQITTVVILRQNMRQTNVSKEDDTFRTALINMRFNQCTEADISFLASRVAGHPLNPNSLNDDNFRYVSIITGRNSHRDAINQLGIEKFANDIGESLCTFYSIDSVGLGEEDNWSAPKKKGAKTWIATMKNTTRDMLWNLSHHASSHLAGKLQLCRGMPVIIKANYATECGVTNGSEGIIVDWISHTVFGDKETLDVVFVLLTASNVSIQIEGLPANVVPVCSEVSTIKCILNDDSEVSIRREQVYLLPNFAMTDFASQGKTRPFNVVDLHNMFSHQAYYTALSRSSFANNTIILQGFERRRMQGGLSLDLKTEFRDLEILDDITRLEWEGNLSDSVTSDNRFARICQFIATQKEFYQPPFLHSALKWSNSDTYLLQYKVSQNKRKAEDHMHGPVSKIRRTDQSNVSEMGLIGFQWDALNYSCAYDALFTCIYHLWLRQPGQIGRFLNDTSYPAAVLCHSLHQFKENMISLDNVRSIVRNILYQTSPENFPYGQVGCSIWDVATSMFNTSLPFWEIQFLCTGCTHTVAHYILPGTVFFANQQIDLYNILYCSDHINRIQHVSCCDIPTRSIGFRIVRTPPIFVVYLNSSIRSTDLPRALCNNGFVWNLTNVVYYANFHYTMYYIDDKNQLWFFDGMKNNGNGVFCGVMEQDQHINDFSIGTSESDSNYPTLAIYMVV